MLRQRLPVTWTFNARVGRDSRVVSMRSGAACPRWPGCGRRSSGRLSGRPPLRVGCDHDHVGVAITDHTRRALCGRSGGVCARCKETLIHDATSVDREALVGEEAHIVSRAPGGPRHGPEPPGGYDGLENLVLLCRVCHGIVDSQPRTYPVEDLRALRDSHVQWVKSRTGSTAVLPQLRFSPIPPDLELSLIASGRQLMDLLNGAEDVSFRHDQPREAADAEAMSEFVKRVEESDMELDAIGPHHAIELSHDFNEMILERLLPLGIIVLGARAQRSVTNGDTSSPWTTCVLAIRYAPRKSKQHGSNESAGARNGDLASTLQTLLAEGQNLRDKARISDDGSSAVIEIWERDVRRAIEEAGRYDLTQRFDTASRSDPTRFISASWATKRRLARELDALAQFLGEVRS